MTRQYRKNTTVGQTKPPAAKKTAPAAKKAAQPVAKKVSVDTNTKTRTLTIKRGRLWTYVYDKDGALIAEIRNDAIRLVSDAAAAAAIAEVAS